MTLAELFSDPGKWCQYASARDKSGKAVRIKSKYAVSWCLSGGIDKCYLTSEIFQSHQNLRDFELRINGYLKTDSFIEWNDKPERTIEEIQEIASVIDGWIEDMKKVRKV